MATAKILVQGSVNEAPCSQTARPARTAMNVGDLLVLLPLDSRLTSGRAFVTSRSVYAGSSGFSGLEVAKDDTGATDALSRRLIGNLLGPTEPFVEIGCAAKPTWTRIERADKGWANIS
jgi:hypothetical protein